MRQHHFSAESTRKKKQKNKHDVQTRFQKYPHMFGSQKKKKLNKKLTVTKNEHFKLVLSFNTLTVCVCVCGDMDNIFMYSTC